MIYDYTRYYCLCVLSNCASEIYLNDISKERTKENKIEQKRGRERERGERGSYHEKDMKKPATKKTRPTRYHRLASATRRPAIPTTRTRAKHT